VSSAQPRPLVPSTAHPVGVIVVQGAGVRGLGLLAAKLGAKFAVTTVLSSDLFTAADPRTARVGVVVVDFDKVPVSVVSSIHAVLPELQVVGLASNAATAKAGTRAGATIVIAKPVSSSALATAVRALLPGR
jgi:DNA-binding NarL/FixJ family response regulator